MKTFYIQIDDCQNNTQAIVKVEATDLKEAQAKALRAIHISDDIFAIDKEEALDMVKEGYTLIDEEGCETDIDDEEDEENPLVSYDVDDNGVLHIYLDDYILADIQHCGKMSDKKIENLVEEVLEEHGWKWNEDGTATSIDE